MTVHRGSKLEDVNWIAIAPLPGFDLPENLLDHVLEFPGDVSIRSIPSLEANQSLVDNLDRWAQEDIGFETKYCLWYEYQAIWPSAVSPLFGGTERPKSWVRNTSLLYSILDLSLWIAAPGTMRYNYILHVNTPIEDGDECLPITHPSIHQQQSVARDPLISLDHSIIDQATKTCGELITLHEKNRKHPLVIASLILWRALIAPQPIRFLLLWVAIESIYGPHNPGETAHQVSQRIGLFLGKDQAEAYELYKRAKKAYRVRGYFAHGRELPKKLHKESNAWSDTELILRRTSAKALESEAMTSSFSSNRRDEYLSKLAFGVD